MVGLDWKRFPKELAPSSVSRKTKRQGGELNTTLKKKAKTLSIHPDDVLDKLEKAEKNGAIDGEDKEGSDLEGSDNDDDKDNIEKKNEDLDSDEVDEELDEGTDYANNFFDNGENYLDDEDDNLDEGGIY